ncbi:MAG TPA: hypothetical protein VNN10_14860 [Dehalococcoidia bacterium]|nr:hypothetical protein [Dehalococcoidia bacterium]
MAGRIARRVLSLLSGQRRLALAAAAFLLAVMAAVAPARPARAECIFPTAPTTYEDLKDRSLFLTTIELAAANMLFPGDPYFGIPNLEFGPRTSRSTQPGRVPPTLMKAISWIESSITQAAVDVPFGSIGPALVSFDCGHGIAQVTSGMTVALGEGGRASPEQALVATHFAYNIARGAAILADKWNQAPELRPVAGTDTNGLPELLENWYFAVWSYNGFTGPGANRSNHPMDPVYGTWPRPQYSCGPSGDGKGHNRANYPYQELVFGCIANPPIVDGRPLWQGIPVSLPDLSNPAWREPLKLANFVFPYASMDIPTPQPFHLDPTPLPDPRLRERVLGSPQLRVSRPEVKLGVAPGSGSTVETITIENAGTGVLAWYAMATEPWIVLRPYAGAAVGPNLPCAPQAPCDRNGKLEVTVDASRAPPGRRTAAIRIQALGTGQSFIVTVEVSQVIRLGVPGITRH